MDAGERGSGRRVTTASDSSAGPAGAASARLDREQQQAQSHRERMPQQHDRSESSRVRPARDRPETGVQAGIATFFRRSSSSSTLPVPSATQDSGSSPDRDREVGLLAQEHVEAAQQRAAAGEHDALVDDVGRELGRRPLEAGPHRLDDRS